MEPAQLLFCRILQSPQAGYFPLDDDPCPGRECEAAGDAVDLAEAALYAFVDLLSIRKYGKRLETLQEASRIVVEYHSGI